MVDDPRSSGFSGIPEAVAEPKRRWSPQLVWLIPLVAALVGGWLAVKAVLEKGPTVTITFKTAEGLEVGKTKVKYKELNVGELKQIAITKDLGQVVATVELVKEAKPYLVEDTRFWIVRPRIVGGQVSGLGTLLTGSYIGVDVGKSTNKRHEFIGLETPPIVIRDTPGRQFVLRAQDLGSLDIGSPVYFRKVAAGSVVAHELDKDGRGVTIKVFVNAPYDQFVNSNTRFWNASGIDVSVDATGIKVETQSLAAILIGGIAFETPSDSGSGSPVDEHSPFDLFANRAQAMKRPDVLAVPAVLYFNQSLRGLSVGASVEFRGIPVGEVKSINAEYNEAQDQIRLPVGIEIFPERLAAILVPGAQRIKMDEASRRMRLDALVERGMRAQLRSGSLLNGQVYVALDFFPNAPKAKIDWAKPVPVLPTIPSSLEQVQEMLIALAKKLETMPVEEISADLRQALQTMNQTLKSMDKLAQRLEAEIVPATRNTLATTRRSLDAVERVLAEENPLQQDLREALRGLTRAAKSMRVLTDYLERHPEALIRGKRGDER
jgi:paraquat-inducible protein B